MYMWTDEEAKRGSDKVCSAKLKYVSSKTYVQKTVCLPNAAGQNKNWMINVAFISKRKWTCGD
jgi:hypothetical protein